MQSADEVFGAHVRLTHRFQSIKGIWDQFVNRWAGVFTDDFGRSIGWTLAEQNGGLVIGVCERSIELRFGAALKGGADWEGTIMVLVQTADPRSWVSAGRVTFQATGKTGLQEGGVPLHITRDEEGFLVLARAVEMGLSVVPERLMVSGPG